MKSRLMLHSEHNSTEERIIYNSTKIPSGLMVYIAIGITLIAMSALSLIFISSGRPYRSRSRRWRHLACTAVVMILLHPQPAIGVHRHKSCGLLRNASDARSYLVRSHFVVPLHWGIV